MGDPVTRASEAASRPYDSSTARRTRWALRDDALARPGIIDRKMVSAGVTQIAVGAAAGWSLAALYASPDLQEKAGVVDVRRLRQVHLDMIIMGGLVAVAGTVNDVPRWARTATRVGAWTNALLFVPMAFRRDAPTTKPYQAASVASFTLTSAGWLGIARAAHRWARS